MRCLTIGRALAATGSSPHAAARRLTAAPQQLRVIAPTEAATQRLAELLAEDAQPGDCICLYGQVGAGKSFFSRAFIRWALAEPSMPVPSPTYLLQNVYDDVEGLPIHHMDLYRITAVEQLFKLQLADSWRTAVSLIEWPERLGSFMPAERLSVTLQAVEEIYSSQPADALIRSHVDADAAEDLYADRQCRLIELQPYGERWEAEVSVIQAALADGSDPNGAPVQT